MAVQLNDVITILDKLIGFDTISSKSNLDCIQYIADYLKPYGIEPVLLYDESKQKANLFSQVAGKLGDAGGVVLSGHTDVVPIDGQDWHSEPFSMLEKDGKYVGRGTSDMKTFLAVALAMVPDWQKMPYSKPVCLAFSYDEEVGGLGVPLLVNHMKEVQLAPDFIWIGEPTEMKLAHTHKGVHYFCTKLKGVEAHSSIPHKAVNAISCASRLIGYLADIDQELMANGDDAFDPPHTTISVNMIDGGIAGNIIPKDCKLYWDMRAVPGDEPADVLAKLEAKVQALQNEVKQQTGLELDVETEKIVSLPALPAQNKQAILDVVQGITGANQPVAVPFGTEGGVFSGEGGYATFVCGPGSVNQAHQPNEYIEASQIELCLKAMGRLGEWLSIKG